MDKKHSKGRLWWVIFLITGFLFSGFRFSEGPEIQFRDVVPPHNEELVPLSQGKIIKHAFYLLSFNNIHKQANWVYYRLRPDRNSNRSERTNNFRIDPKVPGGSAKPSDYTGSGYDRGHLCPAGDMTHSPEAMSETFYMSNMSPQVPAFNRGIWKNLETEVRKWKESGEIYVVTGPVFKELKGHIGKSGVTVPGFFYKVVYSPSHQQMIGFILPNRKCVNGLAEYVVPVDSVENFTGIDFFSQLPDSLENRLEAVSDWNFWKETQGNASL